MSSKKVEIKDVSDARLISAARQSQREGGSLALTWLSARAAKASADAAKQSANSVRDTDVAQFHH